MTTIQSASGAAHVDAYRATGSSPGPHAPAATCRSGTHVATLELEHHGPVSVPLRYEAQGPPGGPAVVVLGGISASRHVAPTIYDRSPGWWPGVVGPGCALDPASARLIGFDWLGAPRSGWRPPGPLTTLDHARGLATVLDHLEVARATLVGASFGGMVALALAALDPERVASLVVLCAAHRPHPMATAVRAVQRDVLRLGVATGHERRAVEIARALAMTSYRSAEEVRERFGHRAARTRDPVRFPVERYLHARARAFADVFDAPAFLRLSESIDLHDVDPARVRAPLLALSVDTDVLSPPWLVEELVAGARGPARHARLTSPKGHDAFLTEREAVSRFLAGALATVEVAR